MTRQSCPTDCMLRRDKAAIAIVSTQRENAHEAELFVSDTQVKILTGPIWLLLEVTHLNPGSHFNQTHCWQTDTDQMKP